MGDGLEPVDVEQLRAARRLGPVHYETSCDSTQLQAHRYAADHPAAGSTLPELFLAEEQTAGRGRGANQWYTGRGSLALSLLFQPGCYGLARHPLPQASMAIGVAVVDTVTPYLKPSQVIGLHWPNDVFAAGRKLSGILIDVLPDGRNILGIGLNVNNSFAAAPAEVQQRAISLVELAGNPLDRTRLLLALLAQIEQALRALAAAPEMLGPRFEDLCLQRGHDLTVVTPQRQITGRCAGIAHDGALLLDTFTGRQKVYSGVLR